MEALGMNEAVDFMVLDAVTGNAVAFFESQREAEAHVLAVAGMDSAQAEEYQVVGLDKTGFPISAVSSSDLLASR